MLRVQIISIKCWQLMCKFLPRVALGQSRLVLFRLPLSLCLAEMEVEQVERERQERLFLAVLAAVLADTAWLFLTHLTLKQLVLLRLVQVGQVLFLEEQLLAPAEHLVLLTQAHQHCFWLGRNLVELLVKMVAQLCQPLDLEVHLTAMPEEQPMWQALAALEAVLPMPLQEVEPEVAFQRHHRHSTVATGQLIRL
jgi:hypothetical protein